MTRMEVERGEEKAPQGRTQVRLLLGTGAVSGNIKKGQAALALLRVPRHTCPRDP